MHVTAGKRFDSRRNTSAVRTVPPDALPEALRALRVWRAANPENAAWITDGAPRLTDDEHRARFGAPYTANRRKAA